MPHDSPRCFITGARISSKSTFQWLLYLGGLALNVAIGATAYAQITSVTLAGSASPSAAQPAVHLVSVTGSNFPSGTISPSQVLVTIQPAAGPGASASTTASSVATVIGSTRRITFQVPASISVPVPQAYRIAMLGD